MPLGRNAPKLCPALPVKRMRIVLSGRPSSPWRSDTAEPSMVPTVRFTLRIGSASSTGSMFSIAGRQSRISSTSSAFSSPCCWPPTCRIATASCGGSGRCRIALQSSPFGSFQLRTFGFGLDQVGAADHVVELRIAELREDLARLLGHEAEEAHHVLGVAGELLAQLRVLRGDADRAGVQVADAHQDAAERDQRDRAEAELVRAEHRADHDVAAGAELPVDVHANAAAQVVHHQRLLRLGEPDLPRHARVLDRGERRRARAALEAGDLHRLRVRLRDACGDRADTGDRTRASR